MTNQILITRLLERKEIERKEEKCLFNSEHFPSVMLRGNEKSNDLNGKADAGEGERELKFRVVHCITENLNPSSFCVLSEWKKLSREIFLINLC